MAVELSHLAVNGVASDTAVRITTGRPIFSWELTNNTAVITDGSGNIIGEAYADQVSYEFRLGSSSTFLGTNSFIGDIVDTGIVTSSNLHYDLANGLLSRGTSYFAQVRITDGLGNTTEWATASLRFNALPSVSSVSISPSSPSINDDLTLNYVFSDLDSDVESGSIIRWYRNGVQFRALDGRTSVESDYLNYEDVWSADILPSDGYEYGERVTASSVAVASSSPVVEDVYISPNVPTENDILKVNYFFDSETGNDSSMIRWYVNGELQTDHNDQQYVRLRLSAGDTVRAEVIPSDGVSSGTALASEEVTVAPGDFVIQDIRIEGQYEPLAVLTRRPLISWKLLQPPGRNATGTSLKIGTFFGADNVHTVTLPPEQMVYEVPSGILNRGRDYYVSIAASDDGSYDTFYSSHFRIQGSRWNETASNSVGWTFQASFYISSGDDDVNKYQSVQFEDGTKFGELRIYANKLVWVSTSETASDAIVLNKLKTVTVAGKGSDVKVYLDGKIVINGEGKLDRASDSKSLIIGGGESESLVVNYYSIFYTTSGDYYPDSSPQYGDLCFEIFSDFESQELVGIKGVFRESEQYKIVAANPFDERIGGSIYKITTGSRSKYATVNPTLTPINRIKLSANLRYSAFAHSRGLTVFDSYYIIRYDAESDFQADQSLPPESEWSVYQNIGREAASIDSVRGLIIDTSFDNIGTSNLS